jgi:hypothetical protein
VTEQGIHKRLDKYEEIADAVMVINARINGCGFNFREDSARREKSFASSHVNDLDNATIILSSFDLSYYHDLEIVFYNVCYSTIGEEYMWWDHWTKNQLELQEEIFKDGKGNSFFEFRFNIGANRDDQYIIRAEKFSYHFEHMSY